MSIVSQVEDGMRTRLAGVLLAGGVRDADVIVFPGVREWDQVLEFRLRTPGAAIAFWDVGPEDEEETGFEQTRIENWALEGAVILVDENLRGLPERARGSGVTGESAGLWRLYELCKVALKGKAVDVSQGSRIWRTEPIGIGRGSLLEGTDGEGRPKVGLLVVPVRVRVVGVEIDRL